MGIIATWLIVVCALIAAGHAAIAWFREHSAEGVPQSSSRQLDETVAVQRDDARSKGAQQKRAEFEAAVADAITDGIPHWKAYSDAVESFRGR